MAYLYGEEKTEREIVEFVKNYIATDCNKGSRFNVNMSLISGKCNYILDYGCGWGQYAIALRNRGNRVYGVDLSQNAIDICNIVWGKGERITFACKTIKEFDDKTFDVILSSQVIEHVHNVGNYLSEINRVLKLNGQLVISLPNIMNPRFFLIQFAKDLEKNLKKINAETLENYTKGSDHINAWDPSHFVRLLSTAGFLLERYIPSEGIPFPFKKPFKPYVRNWVSRLNRIKNLSYTMHFSCKKVKDVHIDTYE